MHNTYVFSFHNKLPEKALLEEIRYPIKIILSGYNENKACSIHIYKTFIIKQAPNSFYLLICKLHESYYFETDTTIFLLQYPVTLEN